MQPLLYIVKHSMMRSCALAPGRQYHLLLFIHYLKFTVVLNDVLYGLMSLTKSDFVNTLFEKPLVLRAYFLAHCVYQQHDESVVAAVRLWPYGVEVCFTSVLMVG